MTSDQDRGQSGPLRIDAEPQYSRETQPNQGKTAEPEWAGGLRKLYDSVVEEPIPDSFKDLLAKLDGGK